MVDSKVCPKCGNSDPMTFHFQYSLLKGYKNQYDKTKGYMYCINCDYESKPYNVGIDFGSLLDSSTEKITVVTLPPKEKIIKNTKAKIVIEVEKTALSSVLLTLESSGFSDVRILFDKEAAV